MVYTVGRHPGYNYDPTGYMAGGPGDAGYITPNQHQATKFTDKSIAEHMAFGYSQGPHDYAIKDLYQKFLKKELGEDVSFDQIEIKVIPVKETWMPRTKSSNLRGGWYKQSRHKKPRRNPYGDDDDIDQEFASSDFDIFEADFEDIDTFYGPRDEFDEPESRPLAEFDPPVSDDIHLSKRDAAIANRGGAIIHLIRHTDTGSYVVVDSTPFSAERHYGTKEDAEHEVAERERAIQGEGFHPIIVRRKYDSGMKPPKRNPLSVAQRRQIPAAQFVFPRERTWPIPDESHAMRALVMSNWPRNRSVAVQVQQVIKRRYPYVWRRFKGRRFISFN